MARTDRYRKVEQGRVYSRSYSFAKQERYVDGSAAPAYEEEPKRLDVRNLEFWRSDTRKQAPEVSKSPARIHVVFLAAAYLVAVFLAIGAVNVTLSGATQGLAQETQKLQASIDSAREAGKASEVQLGLLSNPTRIKEKAEELGMQADSNPITINLNNDNLVLDKDGNIALAGTLARISGD